MLKRSIPHLAGLPVLSLFDVPIDENGFVDWLIDAEPGARLIYYRGHLAHDRMASTEVHDPLDRVRLNRLASRVMRASDDGLVVLVQKRLGPSDALYIAIRARAGLKLPGPAPFPVHKQRAVKIGRHNLPAGKALAA
jgi:hypothetical protein